MAENSVPPLPVPDQISEDGILIGWSLEHEHEAVPIGFSFGRETPKKPAQDHLDPILYQANGHLMTIAPTGAGKGVGSIIPTILRYDGQIIVIDPKGENYAVTARRRREMGQDVVLIDPFNVCGEEEEKRGCFNPLDLIAVDSPCLIADCAMLAEMIVLEHPVPDPFWDNRARQLITALIAHVATARPPILRNLSEVHYLLNQSPEDMQFTIKEIMKSRVDEVRLMASAAHAGETKLNASIRTVAQSHAEFLRDRETAAALAKTSFQLDDFIAGKPMSLYFVIPPEKLESHGRLLRLWITSLISLLTKRRSAPETRTLFLLDEVAQLGYLPQLRTAMTLLRGYGVQTWTFWQDLSQLKFLYPNDWETLFNNCKVVQAFGIPNIRMARTIVDLTGYPDPFEILHLDADEIVLLTAGDEAVIAQRPNYLTDKPFQGLFDPNPYHKPSDDVEVTAQKPQRHYQRPAKKDGSGPGIEDIMSAIRKSLPSE